MDNDKNKKQKKLLNAIMKENKYENEILLVLSIIGIVIGILILTGVVTFVDDKEKNETLMGILLTVLGFISVLISIFKINKNSKFNKLPKPIIYQKIKEAYKTQDDTVIKNIFLDNGYTLYKDDAIGIEEFNKEYWLMINNEKAGCFIKIRVDTLTLELYLNDKEEENVKDEFYDMDEDIFYKEYPISENTDFDSLINMINMFYDEKLDMLLERFEQFKKE